jgi:hypothetical protein
MGWPSPELRRPGRKLIRAPDQSPVFVCHHNISSTSELSTVFSDGRIRFSRREEQHLSRTRVCVNRVGAVHGLSGGLYRLRPPSPPYLEHDRHRIGANAM